MGLGILAQDDRPLHGITVLDFSQFMAGPVAALRLADLGARVIKIERPEVGDIGRALAFGGLFVDGDALSFHMMNRGKESLAADLKDSTGLTRVRELVTQADVIIQNFRPGVMERIGLGYEAVREINPRIVYGSVSGYGADGPWRDRPGQDLLAQSISGLPWLNGHRDQGPVPVGVSIADLLASVHLAHGITALLLRRERSGVGGLVETSLLEGVLDLQFEVISAYLNDRTVSTTRGGQHSASAFLPAPYGVYSTSDGYLAMAMSNVPDIGRIIGLDGLRDFRDPATWWSDRDRIEELLADHLAHETTDHWLNLLDPADIWCAPVLTLPELVGHDGFASLRMTQQISSRGPEGGPQLTSTRSPLRIDNQLLSNPAGAPRLGEHTEAIQAKLPGRTGEETSG